MPAGGARSRLSYASPIPFRSQDGAAAAVSLAGMTSHGLVPVLGPSKWVLGMGRKMTVGHTLSGEDAEPGLPASCRDLALAGSTGTSAARVQRSGVKSTRLDSHSQ